jgi:hypothetical protein
VEVAALLKLLISGLHETLPSLSKLPTLCPPRNMIQVGNTNSMSVDASDGRATISKSVIAYSDLRQSKERLNTTPTLNVPQQDESGDAAFDSRTLLHQHDERESKLMASDIRLRDNEKEKNGQCLWLVPHTAECQKRIWHSSSLGIGTKHVVDVWGFSSASVSRSHSPNNASEPHNAENVIGARK